MTRQPLRQSVPPSRRGPGRVAADLIVVAVDGSDASIRALVWALHHAVEHGLRVEALTTWPLRGPVFVREVAGHFCEPRWRAREVQAQAVARALAAVVKAPAYELRVVNAELVDALARARRRAVMVVIGSDRPDQGSDQGDRLTSRVRRTVPGPVVVVGPDGPIDRTETPLLMRAE
jgi:hypothetical protein